VSRGGQPCARRTRTRAADDIARRQGYRRDALTWTAFGALFAFGFLNAVLGPVLPYIRAVEKISYLAGALHQFAFAVGGGLAGLLAARQQRVISRGRTIRLGLSGAALAGLAVGYGDTLALTLAGALLMGLLAIAALIRVWAALADLHSSRRAVAMTEGEVSVSLAGIFTPLLIGGLAATTLTWRFGLVIVATIALLAAITVARVRIPPPCSLPERTPTQGRSPDHRWLPPTLIVVFAIVALEFSLSFWLASYLNDEIGLARNTAVAIVSGLYAANLIGRLFTSRFARRVSPERLLASALMIALVGVSVLLAATGAALAMVGIAIAGMGIGATFPLASALHVQVSGRIADNALGQTITIASAGQILGPLTAGAIAQAVGLRLGLLVLPTLVLIAAAALSRHRRDR
jgi:fucose permease